MAYDSFTHTVVVWPSAGGIGALSGLVSSMPEDFDAPVVAAKHRDPNRESHPQEILAHSSPEGGAAIPVCLPLRNGGG